MPQHLQFGWGLPPGSNFPILRIPALSRADFLTELDHQVAQITAPFDSAWVIDHLQFDDADLLEGWTTLSYFMGHAPHLHFGNLVLSQSFRNPALLAKMAATVQYLSGNRLYLGIGTGWKEDEYHAYGYPYPAPGTRVDQLDEAITIIRRLWTSAPASFTGQHYRIQQAWCEPRPVPAPPIMIGGKKPRMLRLIARQADWWNVDWAGLEECRQLVAEMERACAEVGRDPASLRRTWFGWAVCAPTSAEAEAIAGDYGGIVGTPPQVIAQIEAYIALGFDYFMLVSPQFPDPTSIELFKGEVIPVLQAKYNGHSSENGIA
ncbi:MAG TPA: LLM class flavin-dependent oxidoreductase [Alphaproteobacteria bacterium]|nr:LLM class flavin-dependent oxidoreductase [Alphaproteobacteria bacterium]